MLNKNKKIKFDGDNNIVVQGTTDSTVNINRIEINELLFGTPNLTGEIPKELTSIQQRSITEIIGRANDLQKIREYLLNDRETLLMNGMGGIGKTTLAEIYTEKYYNNYDHLVWLNVDSNFNNAVLTNFTLLRNLRLQNIKPEQQVATCLNELCNLHGPNLLIIDNAKQELATIYDQLPKAPNWHVLITSRERIAPFNIIDVDFLTEEDAVILFKKHCCDYKDEEIKQVVELVERHTLTIEVLAKAAKRNRWSIKKTFAALGVDAAANVSIRHSANRKIENIKSYLTDIFMASELDEQEKWILKQFTALPSADIDYNFLCKLLQIEKLDWKDNFSAKIEGLYETGFLQKDRKKKCYKLHAVFNEVLRTSLNPSIEDAGSLLESVTALLSIDQTKDNPIDKFPFIPFGKAIIKLFPDSDDRDLARLQNNLALVYQDLGENEKARYLWLSAYKILENSLGKDHPNTQTVLEFLNGV